MRRLRRLLVALGFLPGCGGRVEQGASASSAPAKAALGAERGRLQELLSRHGIDASTLHPLFPRAGREEMHGLVVAGSGSVELWRKLRGLVNETGRWPVILGPEAEIRDPAGEMGLDPHEAILARSSRLDLAAWLKKRVAEDPEAYQLEEAPWPREAAAPGAFVIPLDILTRRPHPRVVLALVPTRAAWEAPAHLGFGGWNECPPPEAHVAIMKRWHDRYGAEVVGISSDVVEMQVARPPSDRAQALELAREQFIYCPDSVHQGTESLEALAAALLGGKIWYFWWD